MHVGFAPSFTLIPHQPLSQYLGEIHTLFTPFLD